MTTIERLREDMKKAMREKDSVALTTIRMVMADIQNREIEKRSPLDDDEVNQMLGSIVKKRRDAIDEAEAAGRSDVAEREKNELKVIEGYLPPGLSEEELEAEIDAAIQEAGAAGQADMGQVMRVLMPRVKGRADGKLVNELVRRKLVT